MMSLTWSPRKMAVHAVNPCSLFISSTTASLSFEELLMIHWHSSWAGNPLAYAQTVLGHELQERLLWRNIFHQ